MKRVKKGFYAKASVLLLFIAFVVSVLVILLQGMQIQSSVKNRAEQSFSGRTGLSFIAEKLRQADGGGEIYTGEFEGQSTLFIDFEFDSVFYTDIIYCCDGWLYELFCEKGMNFSQSDGARILEMKMMSFSEPEPGLIYLEATDNEGKNVFLHIFLRSTK